MSITLSKKAASPQSIVFAQNCKNVQGLLTKEYKSTLDASNGWANIILDFGIETVGYIELSITAQISSHLFLRYGEYLEEAERNDQLTNGWCELPIDDFSSLQVGAHTVKSDGRRAFRYLRICVPEGSVRIDGLTVASVGYPVSYVGSFSSNDRLLNRAWDMCAKTVELCMQSYYEDGIKRDGLLWIGDYRVEFLASWYAFGDTELARESLRYMIASQYEDGSIPACAVRGGAHQHNSNIKYLFGGNPPATDKKCCGTWVIPNYCCDFISGILEYLRYTNDMAFVKNEAYASVKRCMLFLKDFVRLEGESIFNIKKDEWRNLSVLTDNAKIGTTYVSSCAFLFQYLRSVKDCILLAYEMSDDSYAKELDTYVRALTESVDRRFFDQNKMTYAEKGENGEDIPDGYMTFLAVLADHRHPMLNVEEHLNGFRAVGGWMTAWAIEAKFMAGMYEQALEDIRFMYGQMLEFGSGTCWENMNSKKSALSNSSISYPSLCHGWTAGMIRLLNEYVIGLRPTKNGFREIVLDPHLCDLRFVQTEIPLPNTDNKIFVSIRKEEESGILHVLLDLPDEVFACRVYMKDEQIKVFTAGKHCFDL